MKDGRFVLVSRAALAQVKSDDGRWIIEGYAMTAGLKSDGIVAPIDVMRQMPSLEGLPVYALREHEEEDGDPEKLVGRVVSSFVDDTGVFVRVHISRAAEDVWTKINEGMLDSFSIYAKGRARLLPDGTQELTSLLARHLAIVVNPVDKGAQFEIARSEADTPADPAAVVEDTAHHGGGGGSVGGVGEACVLAGMAAVTGAAMLMAAAVMGENDVR